MACRTGRDIVARLAFVTLQPYNYVIVIVTYVMLWTHYAYHSRKVNHHARN